MPSPSPEAGGYPKREAVPVSPEQAPQPSNVEALPASPERAEAQPQGPTDPSSIVVPAVSGQPLLPTPADPVTTTQPVTDTPLMAGDDDLIEKEWVDKAKRIVYETRSDPYAQEKEVSKLQADYIKKRYGKDIKLANE